MTVAQHWSLAKRLTWWISTVAILPMICAFLVGGLVLESLVASELDALAVEETLEIQEALRRRNKPLADFAALSAPAHADDVTEGSDSDIIVTAARSTLPINALPLTVDVLGKDALDQQVSISGSVTDAVSNLTPSFSPRQTTR